MNFATTKRNPALEASIAGEAPIRLRNIEKRYQTKAGFSYVLRQINLDIAKGDFVTVMGPSGAGKSTLLGILGLYDHAWEGGFEFLAQVVVRSSVPASALMPMLRDIVPKTDSRVRLESAYPMTEIVASTVAERRFLMIMVAAYAVVALGVAAVGIFGVVAYQVAQRRNEFGVRLALGASPGGLLRLVLFQAGRLTLAGLMIGLGVSFATNRLLTSQLFGLSPHDPFVLMTVGILLLLVALLASFLPARRAARVGPMEALRCE